MENMDNRVRYTKMVLQQALLTILKKKSIDRITVKELCEAAKVNRGTFYLHYKIPNDILLEIEQGFIDKNMACYNPFFHDSHETSYLTDLFSGILKDKETARIIMGHNGNPRFLERIENMIREDVVKGWLLEYPGYNREDVNYIFDYVFSGSMHLILNWINNDQNISAAELGLRLERLGHFSLVAISQFNRR